VETVRGGRLGVTKADSKDDRRCATVVVVKPAIGDSSTRSSQLFARIVSSRSDHEAEMENTGDLAGYPTATEGSGGLPQVSEVRRQLGKAA
jgi:hypothetical protein